MKKTFQKYISKEEELKEVLDEIKVKYSWVIVAILWTVIGVYLYNTKLENKNIFTEVIFIMLSLFIVWQNSQGLKVFFRNPFKFVGRPNSISNVLWMYPFAILMISVLFVLIPNVLGWLPSDPQNLSDISLTFSQYIRQVITVPMAVIQEESLNVLVLIVLAKFLSKKMKRGWLLLAVIVTSIFFGGLHYTAWGASAAVSRMFIHLPFLYSIAYFRTAWLSILAHIYQNSLTYTTMLIAGFSGMFVTYGIGLCVVIHIYRRNVKIFNKRRGML